MFICGILELSTCIPYKGILLQIFMNTFIFVIVKNIDNLIIQLQ